MQVTNLVDQVKRDIDLFVVDVHFDLQVADQPRPRDVDPTDILAPALVRIYDQIIGADCLLELLLGSRVPRIEFGLEELGQ